MKFKKNQKLKLRHKVRFNTLLLGNYGLKITQNGRLFAGEYKAFQNFLRKNLRKYGFIWFRKDLSKAITRKPLEMRLGKGKGSLSEVVCPVVKGEILVEFFIPEVSFNLNLILKLSQDKLNCQSKIIRNEKF